jgi:hypothetical protein
MWNAMRVLLQAQRNGPPLERVSRDAPLPASFAQVGGWILEQLQPATFLYNLTVGWRMRGDLKVQCLEWSFAEMVRRHEVLRTTLRFVDGRLLQIILPAPEFVMPVIDLSTCEADRRRRKPSVSPWKRRVSPLISRGRR